MENRERSAVYEKQLFVANFKVVNFYSSMNYSLSIKYDDTALAIQYW